VSCFLCGREGKDSHHLGCPKIGWPTLTKEQAVEAGLLPRPVVKEKKPEVVEVLKEGSMTTEPVSTACEFEGCDNPKYSDHARAKFCEEHRDPKNRKE
jgi:hypothetical protein